MLQYKTVVLNPLVGKAKQGLNTAVKPMGDAINAAAAEGWELVTVTQVAVYTAPGCIAGLFGAKGSKENVTVLIFKKEA